MVPSIMQPTHPYGWSDQCWYISLSVERWWCYQTFSVDEDLYIYTATQVGYLEDSGDRYDCHHKVQHTSTSNQTAQSTCMVSMAIK